MCEDEEPKLSLGSFKTPNDKINPSEDVLLLVVRVVGVGVGGSKASMKAILKSQGMIQQAFSSISMSMSSSPFPKNEKRVIRLYQSEPFKPTGRPPR